MKKFIMLIVAFLIAMPLMAKDITVDGQVKEFFTKQLPAKFGALVRVEPLNSVGGIGEVARPAQFFTAAGGGGDIRYTGLNPNYNEVLTYIDNFFSKLGSEDHGIYLRKFDYSTLPGWSGFDITKANISANLLKIYQNPTAYAQYKVATYESPAYNIYGKLGGLRATAGEQDAPYITRNVDVYYIPHAININYK
ncbi:MAG TPA: hypothetical protein VHO47_04615 [Candidatus Babeliales bacterium]|nr:hypothetical protein [Candidatus Babeliales bacterium]